MAGQVGGSNIPNAALGLRWADATQATTGALTAQALAITLPVAVRPKAIRVAANGMAFVSLKIDNANSISLTTQPSGQPVFAPIPASAFPEPIGSVTVYVTCPATTGGLLVVSIGY